MENISKFSWEKNRDRHVVEHILCILYMGSLSPDSSRGNNISIIRSRDLATVKTKLNVYYYYHTCVQLIIYYIIRVKRDTKKKIHT